MQKIVIASGNKGKLSEFKQLIVNLPINIIAQKELGVTDVEETGLTFVENAILKARHAAKITGLPAIADDSGLAVDFLNGSPGIYSARFAEPNANDKNNRLKLLTALKTVPKAQRKAKFHCVLVYMTHALDPSPIICQGTWSGEITLTEKGNNGFGYDPIFFIPELTCTAAELTLEQKNSISHRSKAVKLLLDYLRAQ